MGESTHTPLIRLESEFLICDINVLQLLCQAVVSGECGGGCRSQSILIQSTSNQLTQQQIRLLSEHHRTSHVTRLRSATASLTLSIVVSGLATQLRCSLWPISPVGEGPNQLSQTDTPYRTTHFSSVEIFPMLMPLTKRFFRLHTDTPSKHLILLLLTIHY